MQKKMIPISDRLRNRETALAVIGLGYVGLPAALEFARYYDVIGYDIDAKRIETLRGRSDTDGSGIQFSSSEKELNKASFFVITVPTPIDDFKRPDLTPLFEATQTVARQLKRGDYVVYESTVYPGCTESECIPLLEKISGLKSGRDFKIGYSPERINPNDPVHTFADTPKIVSANDETALAEIAKIYASVVRADIHRASTIQTAEASKMVENVQRNVNIALMNELQRLFSHMEIDTDEVIELASSKWNFAKYKPGLVGGHCIPVDPYYLISAASRLGVDMPVTSASCAVNDNMAGHVVRSLLRTFTKQGNRNGDNLRALLMGVTYKANIDDIRNTQAIDILRLLESESIRVDAVDPYADPEKVLALYGCRLLPAPQPPYDLIIVTVGHDDYLRLDDNYFRSIASDGHTLLADIARIYTGKITSLEYWSL